MGYQWWVYVHLVGVFAFLAIHGVSMVVGIRLRTERDAARINALLDLSGRTVMPFYLSIGLMLVGGVVATFVGNLWHFGWIWAAIGTLLVTSLAMYFMARPYYQRVRFISRAIAEGSQAVTSEQFDGVLRSSRTTTVNVIGIVGLGLILYLMLFKPTLGFAPGAPPVAAPSGSSISIVAVTSRFTSSRLGAPAGTRFSIVFDNRDAGVPHNVAIYSDGPASRSLFVGSTFAGPAKRAYKVPALESGTYFFRCDIHPTTMTGTLVAS